MTRPHTLRVMPIIWHTYPADDLEILASSRRSVSQGAVQKTVHDKLKKERFLLRFSLFFHALFSALRLTN